MLRFRIQTAVACAVLLLGLERGVALPAEPTDAKDPASSELSFRLEAASPFEVPSGPWTERTATLPQLRDLDLKAGRPAIPTFSHEIEARGRPYFFTLVGSDPFVKNAKKIVVPVQIVPVRFEFDDGTILDPSLPNSACVPGRSALRLVQESPLFLNVNYGDGKRQYLEQFRRHEFWALTGAPHALNSGYSVRVSLKVLPPVKVRVSGFPTLEAACGRIGMVDFGAWANLVRTSLIPSLRGQGVDQRTFPVFLFSNVFLVSGPSHDCCVLGFHGAYSSSGFQTYGTATFLAPKIVSNFPDISVLTHELAEWYDDPYLTNFTPPWGHTGQVDGCQSSLENADPLSGVVQTVKMPNGFIYHPQELAFLSWFFDQVPSLGINGWYSSAGTFREPAELCE